MKQKPGIIRTCLILLLAWVSAQPAQEGTVLVQAAESEQLLSKTESADVLGADSPAAPVHHCTQRSDGSDYTDWSYIYFGSYPQTEVTGSALTAAVTGAAYDADGDAWIGSTKYRRIRKSDTNQDSYFGDSTYRYFKWERIRWRVLQNTGSSLLVMADKGLDCRDYHAQGGPVTWENSTIRSWLNTEFYQAAFSDTEQNAILEQTITTEDNPVYGTEGGADTRDNICLLSLDDAADFDYGFCDDYMVYSISRQVQPSGYAHRTGALALSGAETDNIANCDWWLRSPGYSEETTADNAVCVGYQGNASVTGISVEKNHIIACVPVLQLNLASGLWYRSDDGTSGYGGNAAPPVVSPLQDQTLWAGTGASFIVTANGGVPSAYAYQWYLAPTAEGAGIPITGASASVYTITSDKVTGSLNGSYIYCVVSNGIFETASRRAKLTVTTAGSPSESTSGGNSTGGGTSGSSQTTSARLAAPKPKIKLTAANAIKLSWNKVTGASSYVIYRAASPKGKYKKLKTVRKTTFTDKKLKKGTAYYYKVEVRSGSHKALSKAVSRKIIGKPPAPKLKLTAGGGRFTLTWGTVKHADNVQIYIQADNGRWKKWKTVSAKKKKFTYSYNNINWNRRCAFKVRGYYRRDGITVYGNYSNAPALARKN